MSEILRPNPFCGHAVMRDLVADDQHRDIVCAVECDDDQIFRMGDATWNSRPIEDALRAENERLRTATEIEREGQRSMARALSEINRLSRLDVAVHLVPSAENERLRAAATEALAVLTRLADSAAYWSDYDVPVGIVAEIDEAKARLAGVLNG